MTLSRHLSFPFSPRFAFSFAAFSGLLYYACFPPLSLWPLALVALVPFQLALFRQTPTRCVQLGLTTGVFVCFPGFFWLLSLMHTHGGFPLPLSMLFLLLFSLYQAGQFALSAWLFARATNRSWPPELVFALAFATGELIYPQLFPWYFGASLHKIPIAIQTADLAGPITVSLVALIPNVAIASLIADFLGIRRPRKLVVACSLALICCALIYGVIRMKQADAAERTAQALQIGVVQTNIPMDLRGADGHLRYLKRHIALTEELRTGGAQLVVWSESSVTYVIPEHDLEGFLSRSPLARLHVPVLVGAVLEQSNAKQDVLWNSALLLGSDGRVQGRYDKHYLLAFGEYIPFGDKFPSLYALSPATQHIEAGASLRPIVFRGHKISVNICYEDILASFVNKAVTAEPSELIVNLTNDSWFGDTEEPWTHLALAKFRAVEQRRFLVRATNSGVSALIDSSGRLQAHTGTFVEASMLGEVKYLSQGTVFQRLGELPIYAIGIFTVFATFVGMDKLRRS